MNQLVEVIEGIQEVLAICPCCGELFALAEARFIVPERTPRTCDYGELLTVERQVASVEERLMLAEDRFDQRIARHREAWVEQGRRAARRRLRRIDPVFAANGVDVRDVRAVFDPIEYVVFHGFSSGTVELIELISRTPVSRRQEAIVKSISATIQRGDVGFEVLRMAGDGTFQIRAA